MCSSSKGEQNHPNIFTCANRMYSRCKMHPPSFPSPSPSSPSFSPALQEISALSQTTFRFVSFRSRFLHLYSGYYYIHMCVRYYSRPFLSILSFLVFSSIVSYIERGYLYIYKSWRRNTSRPLLSVYLEGGGEIRKCCTQREERRKSFPSTRILVRSRKCCVSFLGRTKRNETERDETRRVLRSITRNPSSPRQGRRNSPANFFP